MDHRPNRKSHRLSGFDYRSGASYFITICIQNRLSMFGRVSDGAMHLSNLGQIADVEWPRTCSLRTMVIPHTHVVMPNHVHLLFSLNLSAAEISEERPNGTVSDRNSVG